MDKLDRSILDTERFIIIERQILQASRQMAAAHRRESNSSAESQALVRQAELNIETSEQRLEFLEGQLEKKRRRRQGVPEGEGKKWTNQLGQSVRPSRPRARWLLLSPSPPASRALTNDWPPFSPSQT